MVRLKPRTQVVAHLVLLTAAAAAAAYGWWTPLGEPAVDASPTGWLLAALATTVGMPFLVLSVNSTLLQRWFASSGAAQDPYSLYRASNLGSLLGLLAFPFVFEPWLPLSAQAGVWIAGFAALVLMVAACGRHVWRTVPVHQIDQAQAPSRTGDMAAARAVGGRGVCAVEPHDRRDDVHQHRPGGSAAAVGDSAVAVPVVVCDHVRPEACHAPRDRRELGVSRAGDRRVGGAESADHAADARQPGLAPDVAVRRRSAGARLPGVGPAASFAAHRILPVGGRRWRAWRSVQRTGGAPGVQSALRVSAGDWPGRVRAAAGLIRGLRADPGRCRNRTGDWPAGAGFDGRRAADDGNGSGTP